MCLARTCNIEFFEIIIALVLSYIIGTLQKCKL
jgi:hypothetical protein